MKVLVLLRNVWKERSLLLRAKMGVFDGLVVPFVLYGCKAWSLDRIVKKRVDVLEKRG